MDILPLSYHSPGLAYDGAFNESTIGLVMISTKNPHFSAGVRHEVKGKTSCNLYETSSVSFIYKSYHITMYLSMGWVLKSMPIQETFC